MRIIEFHNARCMPLTLSLADGSHCYAPPKARVLIPVGLAGSADVNAARARGDLILVQVLAGDSDQPVPALAPAELPEVPDRS